jgi:hypothetical protein
MDRMTMAKMERIVLSQCQYGSSTQECLADQLHALKEDTTGFILTVVGCRSLEVRSVKVCFFPGVNVTGKMFVPLRVSRPCSSYLSMMQDSPARRSLAVGPHTGQT